MDGTFTVSSSQYEVWQEAQEDGPAKIIARKRESSFPTGNRLSLNSTCATTPEDVLNKRQLEWNAWGDNLADNIGNTYGCPQTRQIAYVGIATDCTYTASFNSSDSAQRYILNMVNTASVVFENSFNISLSIQNLTMSNAECPTSISALTDWNTACSVGDLNTRLETFSSWRSSINDNNAYWTLLTGCSAGAGQVGVSWIGALCNSGASYSASSANVVARTQSEWQVFAYVFHPYEFHAPISHTKLTHKVMSQLIHSAPSTIVTPSHVEQSHRHLSVAQCRLTHVTLANNIL